MRRVAIATGAVVLLLSGLLLTPLNYYVAERHELAQKAVDLGMPSIAAALLSPLAQMSDTRALNNLGVLRARGEGVGRDLGEAKRFFARAADRSGRARLNALMTERGSCGVDAAHAAATAQRLEPLVADDPVAANLIHDCLYFDATEHLQGSRTSRALVAASGTQPRSPEALLHAGWAMLNLARTTTIPDFGDDDDVERYHAEVLPIARKAMELLFAAADAGAAGAYDPIGILATQFGEKLGDGPLALRLRERSHGEWLEVGAEKGDWATQCRVAQRRIQKLRVSRLPYTRDDFDMTVALARLCIDRKEEPLSARWASPPEWLVVTPKFPVQRRPETEISAAAGSLNALLFHDADRKLAAGGSTK